MSGSWQEVEDWLHAYNGDDFRDSILDDAVLGCLTTNAMDEVLEDFGFIVSNKTRAKLGQVIDKALRENA